MRFCLLRFVLFKRSTLVTLFGRICRAPDRLPGERASTPAGSPLFSMRSLYLCLDFQRQYM